MIFVYSKNYILYETKKRVFIGANFGKITEKKLRKKYKKIVNSLDKYP